eukprot:scaffold4912_cov36-Prasinocladus_malaysianus.AAC.1
MPHLPGCPAAAKQYTVRAFVLPGLHPRRSEGPEEVSDMQEKSYPARRASYLPDLSTPLCTGDINLHTWSYSYCSDEYQQ